MVWKVGKEDWLGSFLRMNGKEGLVQRVCQEGCWGGLDTWVALEDWLWGRFKGLVRGVSWES